MHTHTHTYTRTRTHAHLVPKTMLMQRFDVDKDGVMTREDVCALLTAVEICPQAPHTSSPQLTLGLGVTSGVTTPPHTFSESVAWGVGGVIPTPTQDAVAAAHGGQIAPDRTRSTSPGSSQITPGASGIDATPQLHSVHSAGDLTAETTAARLTLPTVASAGDLAAAVSQAGRPGVPAVASTGDLAGVFEARSTARSTPSVSQGGHPHTSPRGVPPHLSHLAEQWMAEMGDEGRGGITKEDFVRGG